MFSHPDYDGHEALLFTQDAASGLRALIAIHDTTLGPAFGGCRMYPYTSEQHAMTDVLRLSRGMTYKAAICELPYGGGKSVMIADPRRDKTPALPSMMFEAGLARPFPHLKGARGRVPAAKAERPLLVRSRDLRGAAGERAKRAECGHSLDVDRMVNMDITIAELARLIADVVEFKGRFIVGGVEFGRVIADQRFEVARAILASTSRSGQVGHLGRASPPPQYFYCGPPMQFSFGVDT